jgi:hypothetical protein
MHRSRPRRQIRAPRRADELVSFAVNRHSDSDDTAETSNHVPSNGPSHASSDPISDPSTQDHTHDLVPNQDSDSGIVSSYNGSNITDQIRTFLRNPSYSRRHTREWF